MEEVREGGEEADKEEKAKEVKERPGEEWKVSRPRR